MEKETTRLEAFSDGVFAIAITLLIIEVHVPEASGASELAHKLAALWPSYLAFALSFVTILIMWMNHHGMLLWLRRADGALYVANGFLLLAITALPFSTALLGGYLGDEGGRVAAVVYSLHLVLINVGYAWVWLVMSGPRRPGLAPDLPDAEVRLTNKYLAGSFLVYCLAAVLALVSVAASVGLTLALAAFWTWNVYRRLRVPAAAAGVAG